MKVYFGEGGGLPHLLCVTVSRGIVVSLEGRRDQASSDGAVWATIGKEAPPPCPA